MQKLLPNEVALSPKLLSDIADTNAAKIDGRKFTFSWGDATVLMWAKGTTIPCPLCKKECRSCLVLKTDIGDVYACIHCEKYIMYTDKMEEE